MPSNFENLIGQTFGKLTVISRHPTGNKTYWNCECSCGGSKVARSDHLKKYNEKQQCDDCVKIQNLENLINKAREIYPDIYDYSKSNYKDIDTGIIITCKIHGDFKKSPYHFLAGSGCRGCLDDSRRKEALAEFIEESSKIHCGKYDYSKVVFVDYQTKVVVGCPRHGDILQNSLSHRQGHGCFLCASEDQSPGLDDFLVKANLVHKDKYDYSLVDKNPKNRKQKVSIVCPTHGPFKQSLTNHLSGAGCPACANAIRTYDFVDKYVTNPDLGSQEGILYLMKFSSENEEFLKLGITANLRKRVHAYGRTKEYTKKIIYAGKTTNLNSALIEREMLQEFQTVDTHHHPLVSFDGRTECLSVSCEETLLNYMKSSCELIPVELEGKFSLEF